MTPAVGADIESICRKCGDVWHVVVAKDGDKIAKVQCKQCSGYHKYRAPADAKKPHKSVTRRSSSTRKKQDTVVSARLDQPQVPINMTKPVTPYKFSATFESGDRISHPKFGEGVVEINLEPGKMQVFFPEGRRVLALAKKTSTSLAKPPPFQHSGSKPPPKW